jgi:fatty acid desaturase
MFCCTTNNSIIRYRKIIHLRHHSKSGQKEDIEERLIGLGQPVGWLRVLLTCYPISTLLIFPALKRDNADFSRLVISLMTAPTTIPFTIVWHLFFEYCRLFMGWTLPGLSKIINS